MKTTSIYERVTDTIIELLETHQESDFSQEWFSVKGDRFARNIDTNHYYTGINQLLLCYLKRKRNYAFNRWLTFNQLKKYDAKIKKGSKAAMVVYASNLYLDPETGKNVTGQLIKAQKKGENVSFDDYDKRGYLKSYNVFNLSCVEGLPEHFYYIPELDKLTEMERIEKAENIINATGARIEFSPDYSPSYNYVKDLIKMPLSKQFKSNLDYYNVISHEIGHWTGHESRLNREKGGVWGSCKYAFEELIAEINAAYLMVVIGYESKITDNVDYIQNWLKVMKNDPKFVIKAASKAQEASNFILKFSENENRIAV